MKFLLLFSAALCASLHAQAPFDPATWPSTIDPNATVHFKVVDDAIAAPPNAANWTSSLQILSGGDQNTVPIQVAGFSGVKANVAYLNIADPVADPNPGYTEWADDPVIDILAQVYGDAALLNNGNPRNFNFLIGTLPPANLRAPVGGQLPVEAKNFRWNWVLFRINNDTRGDGGRFCGTLAPDAVNAGNGGVNGGTIRFEGVPGLTLRAVAFGPQGAFGEPAEINVFAPPQVCDPEPATNHVWIDINASANQHLLLLTGGDQVTTLGQNIGPAGDTRKAARPEGAYMNFGITDNYLGLACNAPHPMKICVEYYDDPASVGVSFGPEAYANDPFTGVGFAPASQYQVLAGSGRWVRRSWVVAGVNLRGVNTGAQTGGVRFNFTGGPVYLSRIDMAVLRETPHVLAGQDPLASCFRDPAVCDGVYGDYAEMDLATGLLDGIAPGGSGGDQEMIQAEAGPANDLRLAVRPARDDGTPGFDHGYLNFAITEQKLGPTAQPNARLAVCVTYYDDPALAGQSFWPEVYRTELPDGTTTFAFLAAATNNTVLQGSGQWLDSYVEIPNMKFEGVNQGPQAAARFAVTGKIFFSRVRYAVIRSCGAKAGQNLLEGCKPPLNVSRDGDSVHFEWVAGQNWDLQYYDPLEDMWLPVAEVPEVVNFQNMLTLPISNATTRFFRLVK